jgi:hypothetical protein
MDDFRAPDVARIFIGDKCIGQGNVKSFVVHWQTGDTPDTDTTMPAEIEVIFRISVEDALGYFGGHPEPTVN